MKMEKRDCYGERMEGRKRERRERQGKDIGWKGRETEEGNGRRMKRGEYSK